MSTPEATALIQQIADLMDQYLQLPGDTPLKAAFSQVLPEVQAAAGGGADAGAMPPDAAGGMPPGMPGMDPAMMGGTPTPGGGPLDGGGQGDIMEGETQGVAAGEGPPPDNPQQSFKGARPGALATLKKKKKG